MEWYCLIVYDLSDLIYVYRMVFYLFRSYNSLFSFFYVFVNY